MPTATASDGTTLYYEVTGNGPDILFVHEFAGTLKSWEHQIRRLSRQYRCVAFNARGYPPSGVPDDRDKYSQDIAVADAFAVVDAAGTVWCAMFGAGKVVNYAPDGEVLGEIAFDAPQTTCPAFGGPGLSCLYVTSAAEGRPPEDTQAGCTFVLNPGVTGQAEHRVVL